MAQKANTIDDFWKSVKKTNGCWLWSGNRLAAGYGRFHMKWKAYKAHRISWFIHNGKIPKGLCVLHKCDNPPCVNPKHLFLGTPLDNLKDMLNKKRGITPMGSWHGQSKISEDDIIEIRKMAETKTYKEIARSYAIGQCQVGNIVRKKNWKHVK